MFLKQPFGNALILESRLIFLQSDERYLNENGLRILLK